MQKASYMQAKLIADTINTDFTASVMKKIPLFEYYAFRVFRLFLIKKSHNIQILVWMDHGL